MAADKSTVRVTVDGRQLEAERGTTILQAAAQAGIDIPTLCWHPKVSILAACRICLVEVEGLNKLIAACQTPVGEGMIVKTSTPLVRRVRQSMLELLLARHPLDCLACDKGGWCDLQKLTFAYGPAANRFELPRGEYTVADASPFVERDTMKCILCRRCIRVCAEVRGVNVWGAMYRGFEKKICTFFEQPLDRDFQDPYNCEFCGACIDICPVGALTAKISKHRSRPWEVATRENSCPFCGVGCRTTAHYRPGELVKTTPRPLPGGDFSDLCFRGRFATAYVNDPSRLRTCLVRREGRLAPADTAEAVSCLAAALLGMDRAPAALIGTSSSEEEAAAVTDLIAAGPHSPAVLALDNRGEAEEGPYPLYDSSRAVRVEDLARSRKILVIGQDFTFAHPVAGIRLRRAVAAGAGMLLVDPYDTLLGRHAAWWLRPPLAAYPAFLSALARAVEGGRAQEELASLVRETPGLAHGEWPRILRWLSSPGETTIVLQKAPGGAHERVREAVTALSRALGQESWRLCYLPPEVDGWGVPLMIGAAGFRSSEDRLRALLSEEAPGAIFFHRADPCGESWRRPAWMSLRDRSGPWVVFDAFLTDTAAAADVVIPLPHYLETEGTVLSAGGPGFFDMCYPPPPGVLPGPEVAGLLAGALGWRKGPESRPFESARRRIEGQMGLGRKVAEESAVRPPPLQLPKAREGMFILSVRFHRFPGHRLRLAGAGRLPGQAERLEVHPSDAAALGLADGSPAAVLLDEGRFVFTVKVTPRAPRGQPALPFDPSHAKVVEFINFAGRRHDPPWGGLAVKLEKG